MPPFDAKAEASKLETLSKKILQDGQWGELRPHAGACDTTDALLKEVRQLSKEGHLDEVNNQLSWDAWKPNTLPQVMLEKNADGALKGINIAKAFFDASSIADEVSIDPDGSGYKRQIKTTTKVQPVYAGKTLIIASHSTNWTTSYPFYCNESDEQR
jgi:hypothetical protein